MFLHATCIALDNKGVLLVGPSGVGKSDVALRLIDGGAELVSDDQTFLRCEDGKLWASPPEKIVGLLEIRNVGLMRLPYCAETEVFLYVELVADPNSLERMPHPIFNSLLDCRVKSLTLAGYAASTPSIIRAVIRGEFEDV